MRHETEAGVFQWCLPLEIHLRANPCGHGACGKRSPATKKRRAVPKEDILSTWLGGFEMAPLIQPPPFFFSRVTRARWIARYFVTTGKRQQKKTEKKHP